MASNPRRLLTTIVNWGPARHERTRAWFARRRAVAEPRRTVVLDSAGRMASLVNLRAATGHRPMVVAGRYEDLTARDAQANRRGAQAGERTRIVRACQQWLEATPR